MFYPTLNPDEPQPEKICAKCQKILPATLEYFSPKKRCRFGVDNQCKKCRTKAKTEKYANDIEYRTRAKERGRKRYADDSEHRESVKTKSRERYITDPDYKELHKKKMTDRDRFLRSTNPEWRDKYNEGRRKRYSPNEASKPRIKASRHSRRARMKAAEGSFTAADIDLQYRSQKGKCWHCGKPLNGKYHLDHLIPLYKGGTNWPNNIVCSCGKCNLSKGAKFTWEWNGKLF